MCANVTFTFQGQQRRIIIKPGGNLLAAIGAVHNGVEIIDVRHQFGADSSILTAEGAKPLKEAALRIHAALNNGARTLIVQCKQGMSRSPRCTGAFLMWHGQFSYNAAMKLLLDGYKQRSDDCIQRMSENMVRNWLSMLHTIE